MKTHQGSLLGLAYYPVPKKRENFLPEEGLKWPLFPEYSVDIIVKSEVGVDL